MKYALLSILISFVITLICSPLILLLVKKIRGRQSILSYVDKHKEKEGTLTLGGFIFLFAGILTFFIFFSKDNTLAAITLLAFLSYGLLGFLDDFLKIKRKDNSGLFPYQKLIGQFGIAIILAFFIYNSIFIGSSVKLPFSDISLDFGVWIIPFVIIFYLAVTNSVNLIDGLDGLAGGVSVVILITIFIILGLDINGMVEAGARGEQVRELVNMLILCGGVIGGLLVFLCFNSFPAKIFMGDTGSLALGGVIATLLAFSNNYLVIIIVGLLLVLTTLSTIIQVGYYKLTKKRVFKMTPLHHHFEYSGCTETKIVAIYIIITIILCITVIYFWL